MKTPPPPLPSAVSRWVVTVFCLLGGGLGWWLGGPEAQAPRTETVFRPARDEASALVVSPAPALSTPRQITHAMERVFTIDTDDMVAMIDELGALTRLGDPEVRIAWAQLNARRPTKTFGGSLAAMYLWSRMHRLGEAVGLPAGWGAEGFPVALESERARQNPDDLLRRLDAGEPVSETERRVAFTELVRADPVGAIERWCRFTKPDAVLADANLMGEALADPRHRDAVMAVLRTWQKDGKVGGAIGLLTQTWISRDPAEVERWALRPEQADVRDEVLFQLANARAVTDPLDAWKWSEALPEERRLQSLNVSAGQLANRGPESVQAGIGLIASLSKPAERFEAIQGFAPILAANDFGEWQRWRDTLPPADRDQAGEAAFGYWVNQNVAEASAWLATRPAGPSRDTMVNTLVFYHARHDPDAAVEWIRSIPDRDRRREAVVAALGSGEAQDLAIIQRLLDAAGD